MASYLRVVLACSLSVVLNGCNPGGSTNYPDPATPTLTDFRSKGHVQLTLSSGFSKLPTTSMTLWRLEPAFVQQGPNRAPNRRIQLTLTTPPLTDLAASYVVNNQLINMLPVPGDPNEPDHYSVSVVDDGTTKTWHIGLSKEVCMDPVEYRFVNIGYDPGRPTSDTLKIRVITQGSCGPPYFTPVAYVGNSSRTSTPTSGNVSQCPAGEKLIRVCEACSAQAGSEKFYHEWAGCYANFQTLKNVAGYSGITKQNCTIIEGTCPL